MVSELTRERSMRMEEAEAGISADWGGPQTITGPVIDVPYDVTVRVPVDGGGYEHRNETRYAHFLPEKLDAKAILDPHTKHRGIYKVAVYESTTELSGAFAPARDQGIISGHALQWDKAMLVLGISDLRSIKEQVTMEIGGRTVQFEPGLPNSDVISSGLSVPFPLDSTGLSSTIDFSAELNINGSGSYNLVPVGKVTKAQCSSSWKDPSYHGAFLPDPAEQQPGEGLHAKWTVLHLNRPYPQEFTGSPEFRHREHRFRGAAYATGGRVPEERTCK